MKTLKPLSVKEFENQLTLLSTILRKRDETITDLNQGIIDRNQTSHYLEEQLDWFKRQIFGKRSERVVSDLNDRQLVFEGFENLQALVEKAKETVATHTRRKPKRNGQDKITLPPDLPVQTTIIDIPEEKKICQESGQPLVQMGVEISHKLAHQPGSYYIKEIIRPKYAHPKKEEAGILTAELPGR